MEPFIVTEVEQVRALASPMRSQIMDILRKGDDRSVAELARMIGASGAATHYHVNNLVGVGLALQNGQRRTGPRTERLYRAVSKRIRVLSRADSPEYMAALLDFALLRVRRLEREITAAYNSDSHLSEVPPVRITVGEGRIGLQDFPRFESLMQEAVNLLQTGENAEGEAFSLRIFLLKSHSKSED